MSLHRLKIRLNKYRAASEINRFLWLKEGKKMRSFAAAEYKRERLQMERRKKGTLWAGIGAILGIIGGFILGSGSGQGLFVFIGILAMLYGGWQWAWNAPEHEDEAGDIHFDESAFPLPKL